MRADPRASVAAMYSRARTLRCAGAQPEPPTTCDRGLHLTWRGAVTADGG